MNEPKWYESHQTLVEFGYWLVGNAYITDILEVLYYFEKPWKWTTEHELWEGCNRPDLDEEGWDWFLRKLEELVGL